MNNAQVGRRHLLATFCLNISLAVTGGLCGPAFGQSYTPSQCKIEVRDGYRYIESNGIPNHPTGQFPNQGNPNTISPQSYKRRVPLSPQPGHGEHRGYDFGVAVNGVMFDPGTAELWNNDRRWHYEALSGVMATHGSLGMDQNLAHVQPSGAYHYHGLPIGLLNKLDYRNCVALVGWAADGYPIYGPYGYSDAQDSRSRLKELKSSYRLKRGTRPGGTDGPGGAYDGSFAQDYEYVAGLGDLDEYNGRTGVTAEFPKGTFYYVLTSSWPFVPRMFRGDPDESFAKGPPGGGRGHHHGPSGGGFGPPGGGHPNGGPPNDGPPGGGPPGGGPPQD
ncbi:MAG: YHYH protein [Cyanobacteria bacterium REEB67]|nr:YHYH protein [Cyanobacteria bacterium REEB67]